MSLSFRSMRYFVTAITHQSISHAADALNVSPSAVAAAIDQIEAHFQLKLVNRHRSRGIAATASGEVMARKFARLIEEYEAVLVEGSELKQALRGTLRIGYYAPVAPAFLPKVIADLSADDDAVTFHLDECDNDQAQEGLLTGRFDVVLFVSDNARPQIDYDVLIKAPTYCLLPAGHPLTSQSAVSLKDVMDEPVVILNRPVAGAYYQELFEGFGQSPRVRAYANSTEMVRALVGSGQGCAILNMVPQTDVTYAGDRVAQVPIQGQLPPLTLSVGYDKEKPRRLVSHFVQACRAYFADGHGRAHVVLE